MCIINRTDKLIRIQHEKKHGKTWKNKLMMVLGTFDECAYVKDDDDLCA
jgi:hypothetical protein